MLKLPNLTKIFLVRNSNLNLVEKLQKWLWISVSRCFVFLLAFYIHTCRRKLLILSEFIFKQNFGFNQLEYNWIKNFWVPAWIPSFQCQGSHSAFRDIRDPVTPLVSNPVFHLYTSSEMHFFLLHVYNFFMKFHQHLKNKLLFC